MNLDEAKDWLLKSCQGKADPKDGIRIVDQLIRRVELQERVLKGLEKEAQDLANAIANEYWYNGGEKREPQRKAEDLMGFNPLTGKFQKQSSFKFYED